MAGDAAGTQPDEAHGQLVHNIILFGRVLHSIGIDVNPGRTIDVLKALPLVNIGVRADFYYTLRGLLVSRREDIALFDEAFAQFWRRPADGGIELQLAPLQREREESRSRSWPRRPWCRNSSRQAKKGRPNRMRKNKSSSK